MRIMIGNPERRVLAPELALAPHYRWGFNALSSSIFNTTCFIAQTALPLETEQYTRRLVTLILRQGAHAFCDRNYVTPAVLEYVYSSHTHAVHLFTTIKTFVYLVLDAINGTNCSETLNRLLWSSSHIRAMGTSTIMEWHSSYWKRLQCSDSHICVEGAYSAHY